VRGADQILLPPCRLVEDDPLPVFLNDLAKPDTEETGFRPAHDDDPGRTMLIEQPEELLERGRAPVKLVVDRYL
jgi:hypothetical protein